MESNIKILQTARFPTQLFVAQCHNIVHEHKYKSASNFGREYFQDRYAKGHTFVCRVTAIAQTG